MAAWWQATKQLSKCDLCTWCDDGGEPISLPAGAGGSLQNGKLIIQFFANLKGDESWKHKFHKINVRHFTRDYSLPESSSRFSDYPVVDDWNWTTRTLVMTLQKAAKFSNSSVSWIFDGIPSTNWSQIALKSQILLIYEYSTPFLRVCPHFNAIIRLIVEVQLRLCTLR